MSLRAIRVGADGQVLRTLWDEESGKEGLVLQVQVSRPFSNHHPLQKQEILVESFVKIVDVN